MRLVWNQCGKFSGYEWSDGLGRYRVSGDAATTFFMDHLRKGTYVIEYEVHVDRSGVYQAGTSEIQSLYALSLAVIRKDIHYISNKITSGPGFRFGRFYKVSEVMEKINFQT